MYRYIKLPQRNTLSISYNFFNYTSKKAGGKKKKEKEKEKILLEYNLNTSALKNLQTSIEMAAEGEL